MQSDNPKVDKVKLVQSADMIISQVDHTVPNIPESLIEEILASTGFHSNDNNAYRLLAHVTDSIVKQLSESILAKKQTSDKRRKDSDLKLQLTTEDIVNDLEQKGVKLYDPYQHPQIDPEHVNFDQQLE